MRVIRLLHVFVIGPDQGQMRQEKDCFDMFELTPLTKVFASEFRIFLNSGTENKLSSTSMGVQSGQPIHVQPEDTCRQIQAIILITAKPFKLVVLCCVCISSS